MRVGIDIRVADPAEPGQQRYLWRLGGWLAGEGHDVHFLTVRPQPAQVALPEGTTLHRLEDLSRPKLKRYVAMLELDALLLNPERSRRYRGVPANVPRTAYVLRTAYGTEHYRQKLRSFRNPLELGLRTVLRAAPWVLLERRWERAFYESTVPAPQVVAQSRYMRREILESYRIPPENVHVVHNSVDTTEFSPQRRLEMRAGMREAWGLADDDFCLLFLGHNFRLKGLWQILEVMPRLGAAAQDARLLVAGRGTGDRQRRKAERLIRAHGLEDRVILAGAIRPPLRALAAADALLHVSWHDSFGFVALEAMACGLPVITTRYAGAAELMEHGTSGLLVDPARNDEMAAAVEALADPEVRARMGDEAAAVGARQDEVSNFRKVSEVMEAARIVAHT